MQCYNTRSSFVLHDGEYHKNRGNEKSSNFTTESKVSKIFKQRPPFQYRVSLPRKFNIHKDYFVKDILPDLRRWFDNLVLKRQQHKKKFKKMGNNGLKEECKNYYKEYEKCFDQWMATTSWKRVQQEGMPPRCEELYSDFQFCWKKQFTEKLRQEVPEHILKEREKQLEERAMRNSMNNVDNDGKPKFAVPPTKITESTTAQSQKNVPP
ncbi:hypothetical protein RFI_24023 [Reticulomyxa filosa]|uniref:Uncharacterized protein n=1 Tax=Reticulomyxa filosa TaxID=46433 RepID=X6MJX3_RETFI|nr:hypothetical protein RFI_24023 [Reticulomyxa filosa]|eukprot:ETO13355.1 hypothetical protein RFI_24023 [Reticulomyxa filosa]